MDHGKQGVKGGFLHLFDWSSRSRKKVHSSESELPESSNQGKESSCASAIVRHRQGHENEFSADFTSHRDYHYASSASGDSECGAKAPGVVARLMGLAPLPPSTVNEPFSSPSNESLSLRDSSYLKAAPTFGSKQDILNLESVRKTLEGLTKNPTESKLQKMQRPPIKKFQMEVLPPRSSKRISTTQGRLLSRIKSPGFIPPKNAAYVIEAAAKIIEQSPRSVTKAKLPSLGSSSPPFRVQNTKEKTGSGQKLSRSVDASPKGKEPSSIKRAKYQLSDMHKGSEESKRVVSERLKSKEKLVSLGAQSKVNIQKRDGSTSVSKRSSDKEKEHNEIKGGAVRRNIPNIPKKTDKQSSLRKPPEVLRLNHQKQNCASSIDHGKSESVPSRLKDRKESNLPNNYIHGRANRTVTKMVNDNAITPRKINLVAADPGKELSSLETRTNSKKKPPIDKNIQSDRSASKAYLGKNKKSVKYSVAYESDPEWYTFDKKSRLDIVSFTFTSPLNKSRNFLPLNDDVYKGKQENRSTSDSPPIDKLWLKDEKQTKELECMEYDGNNNIPEYQGRYHFHGPGFVSSRPFVSGSSSCSFDNDGSSSNESKLPDTEISDTASSISVVTRSENAASSLYTTDLDEPSYWELPYIKEILTSGELMSEDFALGLAHKIITPNLFDQLENRKMGSNEIMDEHFMHERKLLFDCVGECLEGRFGQLTSLARQSTLLHNKQYLAEELYREISSWTNDPESMVDEIVDKDMSCRNGKWTGFEFDAFEEGVEIESRIVALLVYELIDDLFS